jgi:hypothetical protein
MEHVVNKSAGFLKASLSLELEELRKLKKDSDLTPLVDRIRQQETNILERKILRYTDRTHRQRVVFIVCIVCQHHRR